MRPAGHARSRRIGSRRETISGLARLIGPSFGIHRSAVFESSEPESAMGDTLVLLNARAGALIDAGPDRVRESLASSLKGRSERVEIRLVRPAYLIEEIERAATKRRIHPHCGRGRRIGELRRACACGLIEDARRTAFRHDEPVRARSRDAGRYRGRDRSDRRCATAEGRSRTGQWPLLPLAVGSGIFQPDGARPRGSARAQIRASVRGRRRGDPRAAADRSRSPSTSVPRTGESKWRLSRYW